MLSTVLTEQRLDLRRELISRMLRHPKNTHRSISIHVFLPKYHLVREGTVEVFLTVSKGPLRSNHPDQRKEGGNCYAVPVKKMCSMNCVSHRWITQLLLGFLVDKTQFFVLPSDDYPSKIVCAFLNKNHSCFTGLSVFYYIVP